jgi:hypothetical protein
MWRGSKLSYLFLVVCMSGTLAGISAAAASPAGLTVDQIIEKNIAARGGLKAWRDIQTMTISGKMDAGGKNNAQLPFVMKLKRPRMSRLELQFQGKTSIQVYNGENGWKVRPFLGRLEVEAYSAAELQISADQQELDGPLIDHEVKGTRVELVGEGPVEGHNSYNLKLTMKNGDVRHLWVDAQSFLEVKIEGAPRKLNGKFHKVEIYCRDYRLSGGLTIPYLMETVVENVKPSRKITIETVLLNPKLENSAFAKPEIPGASSIATLQRSSAIAQPGN